jgi:hypothetical protein
MVKISEKQRDAEGRFLVSKDFDCEPSDDGICDYDSDYYSLCDDFSN